MSKKKGGAGGKKGKKGGKQLSDEDAVKNAYLYRDQFKKKDFKEILNLLSSKDNKNKFKDIVQKFKPQSSGSGKKGGGKKKAGDGDGDGGAKPKAKAKTTTYRFGSARLNIKTPANYNKLKQNESMPKARLQLAHSHGYSGNFDESRQNIYITSKNTLVYYIAAVVVVQSLKTGKQRFFTCHNDDITTVAVKPGTTIVASAQKDPKDDPSQAARGEKDLPKIYIWDAKDPMTKIPQQAGNRSIPFTLKIDNICWGKVARLQWSPATEVLYCICGDADQTLKAWPSNIITQTDPPKDWKDTKQNETTIKSLIGVTTMRELLLGFEIRPDPEKPNVDELLFYGKRKFAYCLITGDPTKFKSTGKGAGKGGGLEAKIKSVSTVSLKKDGEKSFASAKFLPGTDGKYAVGSQSGAIYIGKGSTALAVLQSAHDRAIGAMTIASDKLLTAGSDRKFKTFDIDAGSCGNDGKSGLTSNYECEIEVKESDMVMLPRAIAYDEANGIAYCGTKTNQIVRFKFEGEEASVIVDGHDGQIWALATSPTEKVFATGGYDNAVKVWDAETRRCIATYEFEKGADNPKGYEFCSGHWSNQGDILAFGTEDSNIAVFTYRNKELKFIRLINIPPKNENAEVEGVAYLRFSSDTKLLAAAHMDSNLYIYSINEKDLTLKQWKPLPHTAAPTSIQFNEETTLVKTLTRDYSINWFKLDCAAQKATRVLNQPDPDKTNWADDPLIAGWNTQGLYQPGWDGTDLNDATVTSDGRFVATGDDYGAVRLHSFPAISAAKHKRYTGHAEFVVGAEFLRDDSQLITCGGNDMAIFQWDLKKEETKEDK